MLIKNTKTNKYYVQGEGFVGTRETASVLEGMFALAVAISYPDVVTEDL
jgi:hypothetical protein